jgi:hypothetical protein
MLHRFVQKSWYGAVVVALIGTMLVLFCSKNNPAKAPEATWTLTVNVVDGATGKRLPNAHVQFKNSSDKDTFGLTNSQGQATIEGLLAGTHIFTISATDSGAIKYSEVILTQTSVSDSAGLKKLADQQETVKLFPLNGSISGKILSQLHAVAPKIPVSGITVGLVFSDPDLSSKKAFQAQTDNAGAFQFSELPIAAGLKITIPNTTIGGIDYAADSFVTPGLQSNSNVPMGTIYMRPIDSKNFKLTKTIPQTIAPNETIILTYSEPLDTSSSATFEGIGGSQGVKANTSINGANLSISPAISLIDGSSYRLTVNAFGKTGGTEVTVDTVLVKGGGIIDVVSSNVLDENHQAKDGFGLTDSMIFTFKSAVVKGSAAVTKGETVVLVDVLFQGNSLIVKPKGNWEPGTYDVKISATLADSTTLTFNFKIATIGGLDFVSSNIYNPQTKTAINGLKFNDTIKVVANKTISSAQATLSVANPSTPVPITLAYSGTTVRIIPTEDLRAATAYTFAITVFTSQGESKSFSIPATAPFTTASSDFFPVTDNIRYNSDPAKPVLNFPPNGTIIIKMSLAVKSATAQISSAIGVIAASVKQSADTIRIIPAANLNEGVGYSIKLSAEGSSGAVYNENNFVTNFYVKNTFFPKTSNVRINGDPKQPVLDFSPSGVIVIVMTDTVKTATAALLNGTAVVGSEVKISKDTIRIIPHDLLSASIAYDLSLGANSVTGLTYQAEAAPYFVTGLRIQINQIRVLASNVLTADGLGLTNIPVNIVPYYVLSSTPDLTSLAVTLFSADTAKTTVSVSGDTLRVKPVINLASGTQYKTSIKGKTTKGDPIDIDLTGSNKVFTTRVAVIVVASNMRDANGKPVNNLLPSAELWVKFSRNLSTDLTKQQLGGGAGTTITFRSGATNNNASVRVSNDTLFAKFLPNAQPDDGDTISLRGINVLFDDATTLGPDAVNLKALILKKPTPNVIATNGIVNNTVVDTFDVLGEAWIVSSLSFRSVDAVKNGPDGFTNVPAQNLLLSNVRSHGDTIFFKPALRLNYATEYQVAFSVTLMDSSKYTGNDLKLRWKTERGVYLVSANDMATASAYRPFSLTGDSLVLTFSKPIDVTKTFSIGGFVTRMNYSWSAGNTVFTIKPVDTLITKAYSPNPDYSQQTGTGQYEAITITLTTTEGEAWTAKATNVSSIFNNARPPLEVHTVPGLEVLNTTLKVSNANKSQFYVNTDNRKLSDLGNLVAQNDSVGIGDTLKVYFSAAVDSLAVARTTGMVRLTLGTAAQNVTIFYASSHKTMFIKPVNALTAATNYTLTLTDVQGLGMAASDPNGDVSYTLTFKTHPPERKALTTATPVLSSDTAKTARVQGKRLGYSGVIGNAYDITGAPNSLNMGDVPPQNTVEMMFYELAFKSNLVADTVSHYQMAVKDSSLNRPGNWYELVRLIPARHYNQLNPQDSLHRCTLDLRLASVNDTDVHGAKVGSLLRVTAPADYQNDANIFNYGQTIQIKIRPVLSADGRMDNSDVAGAWSAPIIVKDNIAPCDTDFVANPVDPSRLRVDNRGGVNVTVTPCDLNRTAPGTGDGQYIFTFTFPEDMDIDVANRPIITTWYGGLSATPATPIEADYAQSVSYWSGNAHTYRLVVKVPGGINWTGALPYYAISIAGMKDASGQAIQSWGSLGQTPATGTAIGAVIGDTEGTINLRGLMLY